MDNVNDKKDLNIIINKIINNPSEHKYFMHNAAGEIELYDLIDVGEGILTSDEVRKKGYDISEFECIGLSDALDIMQNYLGMNQADIMERMEIFCQDCVNSIFTKGLYTETYAIRDTAEQIGMDKFDDTGKYNQDIAFNNFANPSSFGSLGYIIEIPKENESTAIVDTEEEFDNGVNHVYNKKVPPQYIKAAIFRIMQGDKFEYFSIENPMYLLANKESKEATKYDETESILEVAGKYGEYLSRVAPQVDDENNINYYIAGSLAQMLYANAQSIEYCKVEDGKITQTENEIDISEENREKLSLTGRKIGDLDIIRLNGYDFEHRNWKAINQSIIEQQIPNINIIHNKKQLANIYGDDLRGDLDNSVTNDRVCRLTTVNGETVYVASPETIIAQKLHKVIKYYGTISEEKKDIKDIVTFVNGIYDCYDEDELAQRVAEAWSEKKDALPVNERTKSVIKKRLKTIYDNELQPMANIGESENNIDINNVGGLLVKSIKRYINERQKNKIVSTQKLAEQTITEQEDTKTKFTTKDNIEEQRKEENINKESVQQ